MNIKLSKAGKLSAFSKLRLSSTEKIVNSSLLRKSSSDKLLVSNFFKSYYKGSNPASVLTYIPNINLTDLARNPQAYVKRKLKIAERIVKGRTRDFSIRVIEDVVNGKRSNIEAHKYVNDMNEGVQRLIDENTPVLDLPEAKDFNGNPLRHYVRLYVKKGNEEYEFLDGHAIIKISEQKNILRTKVQGRDLTRKEYISGGDYEIQINGKIVSPYPDVYPTAEVDTLKKILKHNDIVHCQSPFFNVFEIPTILVLGYDFPQTQGASNVQEYSITAVYEKTIEALKFETRNLNEILSAREAIQSEIEERERILQLNNETINSN